MQVAYAQWAASRARTARSTPRFTSGAHALNINVVGALVELRDEVLRAAGNEWSEKWVGGRMTFPADVDWSRIKKLAKQAKGKVMEPLANVQKRARAARRGSR